MNVFLTILTVLVFIGLVLATAMYPERAPQSVPELRRRAARAAHYKLQLKREQAYAGLVTALHITRAILLVALVALLVGVYGWVWGLLLAVILVTAYPALARLKLVQRAAHTLYAKVEPGVLDGVLHFQSALTAIREPAVALEAPAHQVYSREELVELVQRSEEALGTKERALVAATLAFGEKTVSQVMTPRKDIVSVKKGEFLGPLVLSELHQHGHSRLPVINGDIDHVVGILYIRDLLSLDNKRSVTAEKEMESKVYYVRKDDTLERALGILLKVHHHLLIVIDDESKTVGLLTLEDIIEALVGRRIIEEE